MTKVRHALLQVTGSNVVSVAESEVMRMLILMRNFLPGWKQVYTLLVHLECRVVPGCATAVVHDGKQPLSGML